MYNGTVTVVGTGMIGTSVALALRRRGVPVKLDDRDGEMAAEAQRLGAGTTLRPDDPPADVVVIATPPATVVRVLRDAQRRGLGKVYTDVASVKSRILSEAAAAGCTLANYVPGHPMAGRELQGPSAGNADLFTGRPWALCPHPTTSADAMQAVTALVTACGGEPKVLAPGIHDRVVAAISHAPHLVSAALAAYLCDADDTMLSLTGRGLYDTTRVAHGAPGLWCDILEQNSEAVADVLEVVIWDLTRAMYALRREGAAAAGVVADLLVRGNQGRSHIVGASRVLSGTGPSAHDLHLPHHSHG